MERDDALLVVTSLAQAAAFRYLSAFHDPERGISCLKGKRFIPVANEDLRGL